MEIYPNLSGNDRCDNEFMIAAQSGVEEAFNKLMNKYKFALYFMLLKMVANRSDAEDLTIETFSKAFTNIHHYDPQHSFSTWLFRLAYANAIDHLDIRRLKDAS